MKHLIIILGILLMPLMSIKAQKTEGRSVFGFRGELGVSNSFEFISSSTDIDIVNTSAIFTRGIGAFYDIKLSRIMYIQPSVMYLKQSKYYNANEQLKLNYFQVPIMALAKFPSRRKAHWQVSAGPYISIGAEGKHTFVGENGNITTGQEYVFDKWQGANLNTINAGIKFNGGVNIGQMYFGLALSQGINDYIKELEIEQHKSSISSSVQMPNIMLNAAFRFNRPRKTISPNTNELAYNNNYKESKTAQEKSSTQPNKISYRAMADGGIMFAKGVGRAYTIINPLGIQITPCFYLGAGMGILPSMGAFPGQIEELRAKEVARSKRETGKEYISFMAMDLGTYIQLVATAKLHFYPIEDRRSVVPFIEASITDGFMGKFGVTWRNKSRNFGGSVYVGGASLNNTLSYSVTFYQEPLYSGDHGRITRMETPEVNTSGFIVGLQLEIGGKGAFR